MKRSTTTAVALVIVASFAFAGTALAGSKTIRQTGQIVGDIATSVNLRVIVKKGHPAKISGFEAQKVETRCEKNGQTTTHRYLYSVLDPIPVARDNRFDITYTDKSIGLKMSVQGKVKKHGKAVVGTLKTDRFRYEHLSCRVSEQKFKTFK